MAFRRLEDLLALQSLSLGDRRHEASSKAGGVVLQQQGNMVASFWGCFSKLSLLEKKQMLAMKKAP